MCLLLGNIGDIGEYREYSIPQGDLVEPSTLSGRIKWDSGHPAVRGKRGHDQMSVLIWQELGLD
jgi:hypothetical protein